MTPVRMAIAVCLSIVGLAMNAAAQPAAPIQTNAVLVNLTVKADIDRAQVVKVMPDEIRATVKVYLDGKIQQWYSRGDGRGVVFIVNGGDVAAAKALMEDLPLWKAGLVNLEYTALGPLTPLRFLMAPPAAAGKDDR